MSETYRIQMSKRQTKLFCGQRLRCWSKGRPDHRDHVLAWCDESGIVVTNDPRFPAYRGTYRLQDGKVIRTV